MALRPRPARRHLRPRRCRFSSREVNQFGAPTLITRNTNDVQQVQMLVLMTAIMIVSAPLTMVGGVVMALREDVGLSLADRRRGDRAGRDHRRAHRPDDPAVQGACRSRIDTLNRVLREQISGLRVIRAFVREPTEAERFDARQPRPHRHRHPRSAGA